MIGGHLIDKASDPSDVKKSAISSRCCTRSKTVNTGHWVSPFPCLFLFPLAYGRIENFQTESLSLGWKVEVTSESVTHERAYLRNSRLNID
jgi:hypothetical protein